MIVDYKIHIQILVLLFAICSTLFGQGEDDSRRARREHKEKSGMLLAKVIESKNDADLKKALDALRTTISEDKPANENAIPKMRLQIYVDIYMTLKNGRQMTPSVRMSLWEILAECTVNDNHGYTCIKFIWELMEEGEAEQFSRHFVDCLEKAYQKASSDDWRYIVLALDASGSKMTDDIVKKYSNRIPTTLDFIYNSREWCATLIAAKHKDEKAIKFLIRLCEAARDEEHFRLLFNDISAVHDKMVVNYLWQYLKSEENMFDNTPCMPLESVASRAAKTLYKMLDGFPEYDDYNTKEAVESCRRWMKENRDYKFK